MSANNTAERELNGAREVIGVDDKVDILERAEPGHLIRGIDRLQKVHLAIHREKLTREGGHVEKTATKRGNRGRRRDRKNGGEEDAETVEQRRG